MTKFLKSLATALLFAVIATAGHAATYTFNGSGQLTGATGVDVSGTLYDVTFEEGSCAAVFSGCDEVSDDLDFDTKAAAEAAANSIGLQIFEKGDLYDTDPETTFGCTFLLSCEFQIPYAVGGGVAEAPLGAIFRNVNDGFADGIPFSEASLIDTASEPVFASRTVWAKFTQAAPAPVPLPAPVLLLMGGLVGLGALRRKG